MRGKRIDGSISDRFKKRIIKKSIIIFIILVLIIVSTFIFLTKRQTKSIKYAESSNIDYNISLNKNDFFEDKVLPSSNQYISALIDTININYKYNLQMKDDFTNYKYKYRIEANTRIIEKSTQNDIYQAKDILKKEEIVNPENSKFNLNNNITLNYKKYDTFVKKIVSTYDLSNVDCKTIVTLYVDLLDENDNIKNTSSMNITIPLNVKTVNIETTNNIDSSEEKIFAGGENVNGMWLFIVIAGVLLIVEIAKIKDLVEDIKRNCPQEIIDDIRLKRILSEYKSYIQKVDSGFDISKYDMIRVGKFEDLLKIREIVQNPILMIRNETETKTFFVVTTATTMLYAYEINHGNVKEITG